MIELQNKTGSTFDADSAQDVGPAPGKQQRTAQMKAAVQMEAASSGAAPAGAAPEKGGVDFALIEQMIAAMGLPALPRAPKERLAALRKLGMTPESATESARGILGMNGPAEGAAPAGGTAGADTAGPAAQGKLQAKGESVVRDVNVSNSGGAPLNPDIAQAMGSAMGADFSSVQIHQDGQAEAIGAQAFTVGNHLHFAQGKLDTSSDSGLSLLGHELTHVVQQSAGRVSAPSQAKSEGNAVNVQDPGLEAEADDLGARAAQAVGASIRGIAPTGAASETAQMKPVTMGGFSTIQAKPVVQCEGGTTPPPIVIGQPVPDGRRSVADINISKIAGGEVTLTTALEAAGLIVAAASFVAKKAAPSIASNNTAGPPLRLPAESGATFAVAETGKDLVAALVRVKAAKALKVIGDRAATRVQEGFLGGPGGQGPLSPEQIAKVESTAKEEMDAAKDREVANATTNIKNVMIGKATSKSQTFTWTDQGGEDMDPTYGQTTVQAAAGKIVQADVGVSGADWTEFDIVQPSTAMCAFFRSVRLSANCDDNTVEWWDMLEVHPTALEFVDSGDGGLQAVGETSFTWEDSRTKMLWQEENPMVNSSGTIGTPRRDGSPND